MCFELRPTWHAEAWNQRLELPIAVVEQSYYCFYHLFFYYSGPLKLFLASSPNSGCTIAVLQSKRDSNVLGSICGDNVVESLWKALECCSSVLVRASLSREDSIVGGSKCLRKRRPSLCVEYELKSVVLKCIDSLLMLVAMLREYSRNHSAHTNSLCYVWSGRCKRDRRGNVFFGELKV